MPAGAPPPPRRPAPGEDALSAVLGVGEEDLDLEDIELRGRAREVARVLGELGRDEQPVPVHELAGRSEVPFMELAELLLDMTRRGMVVVEGPPGEELVSLRRTPA